MKRRAALVVFVGVAVFACAPAAMPGPGAVDVSDVSGDSLRQVKRVTPDDPFRRSEPPPTATTPFTPPAAHKARLANGVNVIFVERSASTLVSVSLVAIGGDGAQPTAPREAIGLMLASLTLGSTTRSELELRGGFADLGVQLPYTGRVLDANLVSVLAPEPKVEAAVDLLADMILHPAFDNVGFERGREMRAAQREHDRANRTLIGDRVAEVAIFGAHPYGRIWGPPDEIRAITRADIVRIHERAFLPASMTLIVVGPANESALLAQLDRTFGALKPPSYTPPALAPVSPLAASSASTPRIVLVDRPGDAVAYLRFAGLSPPRRSADWPSLMVTHHILGPNNPRRLAKLRYDLGYVKFVDTTLWGAREAGELGFSTEIGRDKMGLLLRAADGILRELATSGPSTAELDDAKARMEQTFAASFETAGEVASAYRDLVYLALPDDYLTKRATLAAAVTSESVRAAAGRYYDPERLRVIVVGDAATLKPQLAALGWGPIEIRDVAGAVVRRE